MGFFKKAKDAAASAQQAFAQQQGDGRVQRMGQSMAVGQQFRKLLGY
jgi:hypothetical protein